MAWTLILETCAKTFQPARLGIDMLSSLIAKKMKQLVGHVPTYIHRAADYLQWGCVL